MIKIGQDALCKYCEDNNENIRRDLCEGRNCESAKENYLEDYGLVETDSSNTFAGIGLDSSIYVLNTKDLTYKSDTIALLSKETEGRILFRTKIGYRIMPDKFEAKHKTEHGETFYISKEDMKLDYEKLMLEELKRMAMVLASM